MKSWRRSTGCSRCARIGREKRNEKLEEVNRLLNVYLNVEFSLLVGSSHRCM